LDFFPAGNRSQTSATECVSKYSAASLSDRNAGRGVLAERSFFFISITYLRRKSRRSLSSMSRAVTTRTAPPPMRPKNHKCQTPIERLSQGDVQLLTSSPDLIITGKDLFDFVGAELVPLNVEYIVIVPFEARK
jgi:hypothetical protein